MEEYIIEVSKNIGEETMYKLIKVDEEGKEKILAILDYVQIQDLQFNIKNAIK